MAQSKFSTALASKLIVRTTPGIFYKASGKLHSTLATGSYFIHLWNLTDVPIDTTAISATNCIMGPIEVIHTTGTTSKFDIDACNGKTNDRNGIPFITALTIGLSTTEFTQTAGTSVLSVTALVE